MDRDGPAHFAAASDILTLGILFIACEILGRL